MADVAKQIEDHLKRRYNRGSGEPNFAKCLTVSDKFEAHGLGVLIEELMSTAELVEYRRKAMLTGSPEEALPRVTATYSYPSHTQVRTEPRVTG